MEVGTLRIVGKRVVLQLFVQELLQLLGAAGRQRDAVVLDEILDSVEKIDGPLLQQVGPYAMSVTKVSGKGRGRGCAYR